MSNKIDRVAMTPEELVQIPEHPDSESLRQVERELGVFFREAREDGSWRVYNGRGPWDKFVVENIRWYPSKKFPDFQIVASGSKANDKCVLYVEKLKTKDSHTLNKIISEEDQQALRLFLENYKPRPRPVIDPNDFSITYHKRK